ncbi:MAG: hypothetical protein HY002_20900 [Candidatus Rokubacteria bacterium]|nr:hypothetical protein [Candidatus Rokubacteria bacterium]
MHAEAIGALPAVRSEAQRALGPRRVRRRREVLAAYLLMSPALLLVFGILAYPVAWEIWASLTDL